MTNDQRLERLEQQVESLSRGQEILLMQLTEIYQKHKMREDFNFGSNENTCDVSPGRAPISEATKDRAEKQAEMKETNEEASESHDLKQTSIQMNKSMENTSGIENFNVKLDQRDQRSLRSKISQGSWLNPKKSSRIESNKSRSDLFQTYFSKPVRENLTSMLSSPAASSKQSLSLIAGAPTTSITIFRGPSGAATSLVPLFPFRLVYEADPLIFSFSTSTMVLPQVVAELTTLGKTIIGQACGAPSLKLHPSSRPPPKPPNLGSQHKTTVKESCQQYTRMSKSLQDLLHDTKEAEGATPPAQWNLPSVVDEVSTEQETLLYKEFKSLETSVSSKNDLSSVEARTVDRNLVDLPPEVTYVTFAISEKSSTDFIVIETSKCAQKSKDKEDSTPSETEKLSDSLKKEISESLQSGELVKAEQGRKTVGLQSSDNIVSDNVSMPKATALKPVRVSARI